MKMLNPSSLAVLLPTLNEYENLRILYPQIRAALPSATIIVVDDNSVDETRCYLSKMQNTDPKLHTILRPHRMGIGSAHMDGLRFAVAHNIDFVLTMDADQTHRLEDALTLVDEIKDHDLVIGSRYIQSRSIKGWSLPRLMLTHMGHFATSIFFRSDLDMSSGLRIYRARTIPIENMEKNCASDYEYFFTSAILYLKLRLRVSQVAVELNSRGFGKSKMTFSLMRRGTTRLFLYGLRLKRIELI